MDGLTGISPAKTEAKDKEEEAEIESEPDRATGLSDGMTG